MNEKTKSKAARNFGRKNLVQNLLFNAVLLAILVGLGQLGFFFYTGMRWIPKDGGQEMADKMEEWSRAPHFGEDVERSQADLEELVVRCIRRRASINFPENGKIRWELQSLGPFKGPNENMIERFELHFQYPLEVKLLGVVPIQNKFRAKIHVVTNLSNKLAPFAKKKTG